METSLFLCLLLYLTSLYQNLMLATTLVQAFRLPFSSLTWAWSRIYASDEYTAFISNIVLQYFIAKPTPSDLDEFLVMPP